MTANLRLNPRGLDIVKASHGIRHDSELAEIIGVHRVMIYRARRTGDLPLALAAGIMAHLGEPLEAFGSAQLTDAA